MKIKKESIKLSKEEMLKELEKENPFQKWAVNIVRKGRKSKN